MTYILIKLEIVNGEYEYIQNVLKVITQLGSEDRNIQRYVKEVASTYYPNLKEKDGVYYDNEIGVKLFRWERIPEEDYKILKKYL